MGQKPPVKHNNSQDICTRLQIELKPPSEALTLSSLAGGAKLFLLFTHSEPVSGGRPEVILLLLLLLLKMQVHINHGQPLK